MLVRRDARAAPLTRPYNGPFKVVRHGAKFFEVEVNGKIDRISIDRLKKAFVENHNNNSTASADWSKTRSRDEETSNLTKKKESESSSDITQPRKRGRPTREMLEQRAQRRAEEREAERETAGVQPPLRETRFGRISRPLSRL